jgi:hypothetical protein
MAVCLLFPVLYLHTKPSPHLLYIGALLFLFRTSRGLYGVTRIITGFHYAANGAKVGHIYRNMYRQVSNRMQIKLKQTLEVIQRSL